MYERDIMIYNVIALIMIGTGLHETLALLLGCMDKKRYLVRLFCVIPLGNESNTLCFQRPEESFADINHWKRCIIVLILTDHFVCDSHKAFDIALTITL